jgi:hypothetical protein
MVNKSRELYFPSPVFIAAGGVSGNIPPTIDAAIGDITMPKIRVPASHTASFKSFCKQFSLKLESSSDTGIRLRGNKLLNIVAQSAGHKDYKALLMDTIEGNELRISFIFKNGVDDGFMVDGSCAIKHFSSDEKARTELEKIKQKAV